MSHLKSQLENCFVVELSLERSIIKNHITSLKKVRWQEISSKLLVESLKAYEADTNPRGESLPEAQKLYCVKVLTPFLKAGIPFAKLESLCELLEKHAYRLTDAKGMFDLIPFIHSQKQQKIHEELSERYMSLIFDGTTKLGRSLWSCAALCF